MVAAVDAVDVPVVAAVVVVVPAVVADAAETAVGVAAAAIVTAADAVLAGNRASLLLETSQKHGRTVPVREVRPSLFCA